MKETRILMGMPITIEIIDSQVKNSDINDIYEYFDYIDKKFSTYKEQSEISRINSGEIKPEQYSNEVNEVLKLCEETKKLTDGYFDIKRDRKIDPSGLVKGWAIKNAADLIMKKGFVNYYVDAGGDIQVGGLNSNNENWRIGIRNPFNRFENVKIITLNNKGIATSGTSIRGQHIYNPLLQGKILDRIVSLTVIGPNVYEADRFATAAFAMQEKGIEFIEQLDGFEGYMIDKDGLATLTSGFEKYVI